MRITLTVRRRCFALVVPVILLTMAGVARADIACYECHGSKESADYRPVDAPYRNITTGGFQGNHRTHLSPADLFSGCARCHPGSDSYTSSHRNGFIKVAANINNSPLGNARYRNSSSAWKQTTQPALGTCTNINCHFEKETPVWGADPLVYPDGCSVCHGTPPTGGVTGAAGSHAKHDRYYPGVANCQLCHGPNHQTFEHATSAGRPLIVAPRHSSDSKPGVYTGEVNDYLPSQTNRFGSCSGFYCHSNGTSVVTGTFMPYTSLVWGTKGSCSACHGNPPAYASGAPKANSHGTPHVQSCKTCHYATTVDGKTISDPSRHANGVYDVANVIGFSYTPKDSGGSCSNVFCHAVDTGARSWGAQADRDCDGCHESPPKTAAHQKHFSGTAGQAVYGSTSTAPDGASAYLFNCGNCHPIDTLQHKNGQVEVELYNAAAPPGSIKSRLDNADASYVQEGDALFDDRGYPYYNGSCSNVYCHSYNSWTTPGGVPAYQNYSSYRPANLVETRQFKTVAWGGPGLSCAGCHENPPRSYALEGNDGGAGNSHSWLLNGSKGGEEFLHSRSMSSHGLGQAVPGLSCMTCHNTTVKNQNVVTYENVVYNNATTLLSRYNDVPIANFGRHVNGTADVAFDDSQHIVYPRSAFYGQAIFKPLSSSYDRDSKTCLNVGCHFNEKAVVWGTPYRFYNPMECNRCHRM